MEEKLIFKDECYTIVAAAITVWKTLGFGFLEKVYENALMVEFGKQGIIAEQQKLVTVLYAGYVVGEYCADILVNNEIILELKTSRAIDDTHVAQTLNYLKATGFRLGIILNFGPAKMEFKRVVR